jgi:hypothetical protein
LYFSTRTTRLLRLLTPTSPGIVGGQAKDAHRLGDLLGDDHDLALLRDRLEETTGSITGDLDAVFGLIDHCREAGLFGQVPIACDSPGLDLVRQAASGSGIDAGAGAVSR